MRQRPSNPYSGDARQRPTLLGLARTECKVKHGTVSISSGAPQQNKNQVGTFSAAESQFGESKCAHTPTRSTEVVRVGCGYSCFLAVQSTLSVFRAAQIPSTATLQDFRGVRNILIILRYRACTQPMFQYFVGDLHFFDFLRWSPPSHSLCRSDSSLVHSLSGAIRGNTCQKGSS